MWVTSAVWSVLTCNTRLESPVLSESSFRSFASGLWLIVKNAFIARSWWCLKEVLILFWRATAAKQNPSRVLPYIASEIIKTSRYIIMMSWGYSISQWRCTTCGEWFFGYGQKADWICIDNLWPVSRSLAVAISHSEVNFPTDSVNSYFNFQTRSVCLTYVY